MVLKRFALCLVTVALVSGILKTNAIAQDVGAAVEGDFVIQNFRFESGETLPELKLHYRTVGTPKRDDRGVVRNAVLILHGTGGSGRGFLSRQFAGELFN